MNRDSRFWIQITWCQLMDLLGLELNMQVSVVFFSINKLFHLIKFCWSLGGYLVEINSEVEEQMLHEVLLHEVYYWIGLNDLAFEG